METPTLEEPETNETKETKETNEKVILDEDNISQLSYSSFDSIDKEKLSKLGQYTCDECPLIPKIINTDISTKTITFKCEIHGQKTMDIKSYVCRALITIQIVGHVQVVGKCKEISMINLYCVVIVVLFIVKVI